MATLGTPKLHGKRLGEIVWPVSGLLGDLNFAHLYAVNFRRLEQSRAALNHLQHMNRVRRKRNWNSRLTLTSLVPPGAPFQTEKNILAIPSDKFQRELCHIWQQIPGDNTRAVRQLLVKSNASGPLCPQTAELLPEAVDPEERERTDLHHDLGDKRKHHF